MCECDTIVEFTFPDLPFELPHGLLSTWSQHKISRNGILYRLHNQVAVYRKIAKLCKNVKQYLLLLRIFYLWLTSVWTGKQVLASFKI